jgi:hypothetical protein
MPLSLLYSQIRIAVILHVKDEVGEFCIGESSLLARAHSPPRRPVRSNSRFRLLATRTFHCLQNLLNYVVALLHPISLTILLEIARHPELSKYVHQLSISAESIKDPTGHWHALQEMQTSMEKSGLDLLLLTEAFRSLPNLEWVNTHVSWYSFRNPYRSEPKDIIMCGQRLLRHNGTHASDHLEIPSLYLDTNTHERALGIVFTAMGAAALDRNVTLDLDVSAVDGIPESGHFDLTSELWTKDLKRRVRLFAVRVDQQLTAWSQDALWEMPDLRFLRFSYSDEGRQDISFSHYANGPFRWSQLATLGLANSRVSQKSFIEFLIAHQDSLLKLGISDCDIRDDGVLTTWQPILHTIRDLDLDGLGLFGLHSRITHTVTVDKLTSFESLVQVTRLTVKGSDRISTAMKELLDDYHTVEYKSSRGELDVLVDLRKAKYLDIDFGKQGNKTSVTADVGSEEVGEGTEQQVGDQGAI